MCITHKKFDNEFNFNVFFDDGYTLSFFFHDKTPSVFRRDISPKIQNVIYLVKKLTHY